VRGLSAVVLAAGLVLGACSSSSSATRSTTIAPTAAPSTTTTALATTTSSSTTTSLPPTSTTSASTTSAPTTTSATAPIKDIHSKEAVIAALSAYYDVFSRCAAAPGECTPSLVEPVAVGDQFQTAIATARKAVVAMRRYVVVPDEFYFNVESVGSLLSDHPTVSYCLYAIQTVYDSKGTSDQSDDESRGRTGGSQRFRAEVVIDAGRLKLANNIVLDASKQGVNECGPHAG
jgi:hypothetical protein